MTRVVLMACVLSMCIVLPAHTTFALERATLAIIGQDCSQWHDAMVEALEQLDGIARAQADVIPNHLLVRPRFQCPALVQLSRSLPDASLGQSASCALA